VLNADVGKFRSDPPSQIPEYRSRIRPHNIYLLWTRMQSTNCSLSQNNKGAMGRSAMPQNLFHRLECIPDHHRLASSICLDFAQLSLIFLSTRLQQTLLAHHSRTRPAIHPLSTLFPRLLIHHLQCHLILPSALARLTALSHHHICRYPSRDIPRYLLRDIPPALELSA